MGEQELARLFFDRTLLTTGRFEEILTWLYCTTTGSEFRFDPTNYDSIGNSRVEFSLGNITVFKAVISDFKDYSTDIESWERGEFRTPATTLEAYINELLISDIKLVKATCESWLKGELQPEFDVPVKSLLLTYMNDPTYFDFPVPKVVKKRGRPSTPFEELLQRLKIYWNVIQTEQLAQNNDGVSIAAERAQQVSGRGKIDPKAFRNSMFELLGDDWKTIILNEDNEYHFLIKEIILNLEN